MGRLGRWLDGGGGGRHSLQGEGGTLQWGEGYTQPDLQNHGSWHQAGPCSPSWPLILSLCFSLFFIPYFDTGLQKLANLKKALFPCFPFASERPWPRFSLPM